MAKHKHAGHGFKRMKAEHHKDGSHTVHHQHEDGAHADVKHAAADIDALHDSVEDNLGQPNPGEAEANAGAEAPSAPPAAEAGAAAPAVAAGPTGV